MLILLIVALNCGVTAGYFLYKHLMKGAPKDDRYGDKGIARFVSIWLGICIGAAAGVAATIVLLLIRLLITNPSYILWIS